ncbi:DMT family transporter [Halarcobacter ebronensis]|uniref:EamA family transporter n=1 Tax=Halarcobacter ebronensis TaxID=1462615 RepID=A0A4V1M0Q0_9BACT|nr:DMT family transporter [Halarcobacter ebronensis]QKF82528.1 DMT family transporter [Halarcobacter ebronensis]RXK07455.1 EamA family transporter [Halarcobacter ebronensis]
MKDIKIQGMIFAALGVFIISFDALLIRLANVDASIVSFYRGLFMGISMLILFRRSSLKSWTPKNKREFMNFALVVSLSALGTCFFVFSVKYTAAANTVVLLATSSFFAAIFSFFLLKEKIKKQTFIAIIVSFLGVFIVFGNSFSITGNLLGDMFGVALAITMGLELTLLRKYSHFPTMLIISFSGFIVALVMSILGDKLFDISLETLLWLSLMGFIQIPIAMYFIFISTKYISSAEVSLFSTIETTMAPIWLWLFLSEIPPKMTLIGGSLVICAIFINALPSIIKKRTK